MAMLAAATRVAVETLRAHPLRTALSTLGVMMGAGSLAAVLAIGDGAEQFARSRIEREGMQVIAVQARTADVLDGLRVPRTDYPVFTPADAADLGATLGPLAIAGLIVEGTGLASPAGLGTGTPTAPADGAGTATTAGPGADSSTPRPRAARITAATAEGWATLNHPLAAGTAFSAEDARAGAHVAVASVGLVRALGLQPATAIGASVLLGDTPFRIVGVGAAAGAAAEQALAAVVPFAAAGDAMVATTSPRVPELRVRATRIEDVREVRDRVRRWVSGRGAAFEAATQVAATGEERLKQMAQGILVFKILMGAITAISLLVGGIGIMNVLLASIADRTREIGVRKAVGASRRAVVLQFLTESVAIAGAGSLVGVVLGVGGAFGVTAFARARTGAFIYAGLSWQTLVASLGAALLVGLVFGVYPALRAARLSPIDALRYE